MNLDSLSFIKRNSMGEDTLTVEIDRFFGSSLF